MRYDALVFDFDGVIGKTMEDNYRAWSSAFALYSIALDREQYFLLEGMSIRKVAETILEKHGLDKSLAKPVSELKEANYLAANTFAFYPGARECIDAVRERFKLGLVSGATSTRLRNTVPGGFLSQFDVVVTGDTVVHSKPDPEPYRTAADALRISPRRCLAVENAPLGIESAKKAGMDCVAICSTLGSNRLGGADFILDDIASLQPFLDNMEK